MDIKKLVRRLAPRSMFWRLAGPRIFYVGAPNSFGNFGDQLGPILVSRLFGVPTLIKGVEEADLVTVGSILDILERSTNRMKPVVWGAGFIDDGGAYQGPPADFRAVRGKLSASRVGGQPALGDPGLLLPHAFPYLASVEKRHEFSFVVHFADPLDHPLVQRAKSNGWNIINPKGPTLHVVEEIAASRYVLSSSLHGLIVADSLGIPSRWAHLSDAVFGGGYKFADHYSVFGLDAEPLSSEQLPSPHDFRVATLESGLALSDVRNQLLRSFPLRPVTEFPC